ncbi:MAG: hypothetical protein JNN18_23200 [Rubrivivax sp.]|jgi:anaerobic ribonucleoside-triphosphate reductase|nr:hypothetical protein [Rubrivivax sp.]
MADEVTKKDLQSLQGYCNKIVADVQKQVEAVKKLAEGAQKESETNYKVIENIQSATNDTLKGYTARITALEKQVAAQAATIAQLQKEA